MHYEDFRVGAVVDGSFRLERVIASGGSGCVFEASCVGSDQRVALKVLRPTHDGGEERRKQRFLREARVAAKLTSEHALRIYDVVAPEEGPPYLVMEYLEGETVADRVKRAGPMPVPDAIDCILQTIEPLAEMHASGIIHRDLKPSNLFLAQAPDGSTSIKLLDFGIVTPDPTTEMNVELTVTDAELGTPLYMAPEQYLQAKYVDARADVWSLGVTMFQMLAGRPPFQAPTVAGLSLRIFYEEPDRLGDVRPEVPAPLAAIVMKCLAKDPAQRFGEVRSLAKALEPFAGHVASTTPSLESTRTLPVFQMPAPVARTSDRELPDLVVSLGGDVETLDAASKTPLPTSRTRAWLHDRSRLARAAAVTFGACAWLVIAAALGAHGGDDGSAKPTANDGAPRKALAEPGVDWVTAAPEPRAAPDRSEARVTMERADKSERSAPVSAAPTPRAARREPPRAFVRHAPVRAAPARANPNANADAIDDRIE
jgi:serine/threonine-protein kinase